MFQRIGKKRQAKFLSANEVEEKPDFRNLGVKKRQVGNLDPELSNQENFSANE